MLKDEDHSIVDVNAACLAMHGYPRDALIGKSLAEFIPAELQKRVRSAAHGRLAGQSCHLEAQSRRADGSTFDVEIHGVPMQYRGRPHALMMMRDLTEQRRAERARMELEDSCGRRRRWRRSASRPAASPTTSTTCSTSIMGYVALAGERDSMLRDPKPAGHLVPGQQSCARARRPDRADAHVQPRGTAGSAHRRARNRRRGALGTLQLGSPATLDLSVDADETAGNVLSIPPRSSRVPLISASMRATRLTVSAGCACAYAWTACRNPGVRQPPSRGRRSIRRDGRRRRWSRDGPGSPRAYLRAVLLDEGDRQGHRHGSRDGARHRPRARRARCHFPTPETYEGQRNTKALDYWRARRDSNSRPSGS